MPLCRPTSRVHHGLARLALAALLPACLAGRSLAAQARWPDERQLEGLVCHADFPLDNQMGLLAEIARLHREIVKDLELTAPDQPIHIYLFARQATYRAYLERYFPGVPYRRALFIKREGPGMVFAYQHQELAEDLRHEGTHALLHACLPAVPLWLDEGLAEYFELLPHKRAHENLYQVPVKWNARLGMVPELKRIEQIREMQNMGQREYRCAWAWVHFMLHGPPGARDELIAFLHDIDQRKPPGKLSERLDRRLPSRDAAFATHFRNWTR